MCVNSGRATIITKEDKAQEYNSSQAFIKSWLWEQNIGKFIPFFSFKNTFILPSFPFISNMHFLTQTVNKHKLVYARNSKNAI